MTRPHRPRFVRIRLSGDPSIRILLLDSFKMTNHLAFVVERLPCEKRCLNARIVWNDAESGFNVWDPGGPIHAHEAGAAETPR